MRIDALNIKNKRKELLKYSLCISASLIAAFGINYINVSAAIGDNQGQTGDNNYSVKNAQNNALVSMGIRDYDTVKNHVDFYTPDGKPATTEYIESVSNKGDMNEYLIVKYKDDAESQKLGQIFGSNGSALQNYLDTQGNNYTKNLDQLLNIQQQMSNLSGAIVTETGQDLFQWDQATQTMSIVKNADFSKVIKNADADKLEELLRLWKELTGNDELFSMTLGELETIISKTDRLEDVNKKLTANKKTYNAITKVRFTITNKATGGPATNVSVDSSTTAQLNAKYNSKWVSKYKSMTGQSMPNISQVGNGVFEVDFATPMYSMGDKWTKILKNWTTDSNASGFLGTGAFNITPSADPLQVKVEIIGDVYTYYENIDTQGTYPLGQNTRTNDEPTNYTYEKFKDSYYYGKYEYSVSSETGDITYVEGKVPNYKVKKKENKYTTYKWETEYRIDWSNYPISWDYYKNEDGTKKEFWYKDYYTVSYYTKEIFDIGKRYDKTDSINNGENRGDRPLYSVDDGSYVRDIWFKTQYVKYWDYKDELLPESEAYSDAPYIVSKKEHSSILPSDNKPLVRFASESDRLKGKVMTKEKTSNWAAPKNISTRVLSTATWNLAPLSGKIQIPVITQIGSMEGVINEADINIR